MFYVQWLLYGSESRSIHQRTSKNTIRLLNFPYIHSHTQSHSTRAPPWPLPPAFCGLVLAVNHYTWSLLPLKLHQHYHLHYVTVCCYFQCMLRMNTLIMLLMLVLRRQGSERMCTAMRWSVHVAMTSSSCISLRRHQTKHLVVPIVDTWWRIVAYRPQLQLGTVWATDLVNVLSVDGHLYKTRLGAEL